jgi:hypothetical protein
MLLLLLALLLLRRMMALLLRHHCQLRTQQTQHQVFQAQVTPAAAATPQPYTHPQSCLQFLLMWTGGSGPRLLQLQSQVLLRRLGLC